MQPWIAMVTFKHTTVCNEKLAIYYSSTRNKNYSLDGNASVAIFGTGKTERNGIVFRATIHFVL